jgi:P-type E1-E2 ATPase
VQNGLESLSFEDQRVLKGLVEQSIHPLAAAIHRSLFCPSASFDEKEEILGRGIKGECCGQSYCVGSAKFLSEMAIEVPQVEQREGIDTVVYFAKEGICKAAMILGDEVRSGVKEFIQSLKETRSFLLSGDAVDPVSKVAQVCGIDSWQAECHPLEKRHHIDLLKKQGEIVAMLGDGMNDAPALTAAHVGIAVVSATDISVQVSDILMTTTNFDSLSLLRTAAIKGRSIVNQNLFWAFFYNSTGIFLAVAGMLTPLFAAFAMVSSSLIVLFNARRLSRI